jgi:hypothetical protein
MPRWSILRSRACSACMCRKMVARLVTDTSATLSIFGYRDPVLPLQAVFLFLHVKQAAPMRRRFGCGAP